MYKGDGIDNEVAKCALTNGESEKKTDVPKVLTDLLEKLEKSDGSKKPCCSSAPACTNGPGGCCTSTMAPGTPIGACSGSTTGACVGGCCPATCPKAATAGIQQVPTESKPSGSECKVEKGTTKP
jgi:hypothetical protein